MSCSISSIRFFKGIFFSILIAFCLLFSPGKVLPRDSMLEFEKSTDGSVFNYLGSLDNCFTSGKILYPWEFSDLNNVCIPTILKKSGNQSSCLEEYNPSTGTWSIIASASRFAVYMSMMQQFPVGTVLAFLAMGAEYVIMVDVCTNAYIVKPSEWMNLKTGSMTCERSGDEVINTSKSDKRVEDMDIPFFFHCDPYYDPVSGKQLDSGSAEDAEYISRTWGYMGSASPYCVGKAGQIIKENDFYKEMVGKVAVQYMSGWRRMWHGKKVSDCGRSHRQWVGGESGFRAGDDKYKSPAHYHGYYTFDRNDGRIKLCVATPWTLLPIKVGCTYVPPPSEDMDLDMFIKDYLKGTRCYYFLTGRTDLYSLGRNIEKSGGSGATYDSMVGFLQSDLHVMSTVIGCIQDLLYKVFVDPSETTGENESFFATVQKRLKQIVLAVLVVYVSIVGIKIMSSPQVPPRHELVMYVVKFGLVLFFATGNIWYDDDNGNSTSIYGALINGSQEIANFFMAAQNESDPVGLCAYSHTGSTAMSGELLQNGQKVYGASKPNFCQGGGQVGSLEATIIGGKTDSSGCPNTDYVFITMWDLIDCKIINYFNMGTCKYTISGLVSLWTLGAILSGINGFLLAIVSFIYCYMLLRVIFKFTHIFILSLFVITVLVLVSPIMILFSLFEFTKSIFTKWMSMLIGYVLYPALIFAFVALMLATFDSVFYGEKPPSGQDMTSYCQQPDQNSVYCTTAKMLPKNDNNQPVNSCSVSLGQIGNTFTKTLNLGPLGKFTIIKANITGELLQPMLKLMLFAFLFYLFMNSITTFMSILTGVQDLGGIASGGVDLVSAAKGAGSVAASVGGKVAGAIMPKVGGGGGGSGGSSGQGGGGSSSGGSGTRSRGGASAPPSPSGRK